MLDPSSALSGESFCRRARGRLEASVADWQKAEQRMGRYGQIRKSFPCDILCDLS